MERKEKIEKLNEIVTQIDQTINVLKLLEDVKGHENIYIDIAISGTHKKRLILNLDGVSEEIDSEIVMILHDELGKRKEFLLTEIDKLLK